MKKLIFLLLTFALEQILYSCPEYVFKRILYRNRLVDVVLQLHVFMGVSVKECAEKCSEISNCDSFSYKPDTIGLSECYLYNKRVWAGQVSNQHDGLVTYWRLADSCPVDYIYNKTYNVCYKEYIDNPKDWLTAMNQCEQDGGYLFIANTMDKLQMLDDYLKSLPASSTKTLRFVGATDKEHAGKWEWLDGSETFHLSVAEPNGDVTTKCAGLNPKQFEPSQLLDVKCNNLKHFFCEVPLNI